MHALAVLLALLLGFVGKEKLAGLIGIIDEAGLKWTRVS